MRKIKLLAFTLCIVILLASFIGCRPPDERVEDGTIQIHVVEKGYGRDWIEILGEAFTEKTGIEVKVLESGMDDTYASLQLRQNTDIDIFITTENKAFKSLVIKNYVSNHEKCWLDLSDVFDAPAEGYVELGRKSRFKN